MFSKRLSILALCAYMVFSAQAFGQQGPDHRFELSAGIFLVDFDTTTKVGGLGPNDSTTVSLEDDLGMDSDDEVLFATGRWYFARRHSLGVSYLNFDRTGDTVLERDLPIGDTEFTVGLTADSFLDYNWLGIDYRFAVFKTDKLDAGVVLALGLIDFNFGVQSTVFVNDTDVTTLQETEAEEYPVPTFGVNVKYAIIPDLIVTGGFGYLDYSASNWEASMLTIGAELQYYPWRNVGFGVGYNFVDIEYDEEKKDPFNVDFEYDGVAVRVITRF